MSDGISAMEPMLPSDGEGALEALSVELIRDSAALGAVLRPATRDSVVQLLRQMNSYYSNLIEGHHTHPLMIERALKADYSKEPAKRALQEESRAHVQVQELIEARLASEPDLEICTPEFLCWIHEEFYKRMPDDFRFVKDHDGKPHRIEPGRLREEEVTVGRHVPPSPGAVRAFLARFADVYSQRRLKPVDRIIAAAASHHRLAWIHPFVDGNGRVTRLFTHAYLIRAGVDGHRLWMVSRGLARRRDAYFAALAAADEPRRGDLDGRGHLSNRELRSFCEFFLRTALDQVGFMQSLLDLDTLERRVVSYLEKLAVTEADVRPEASFLVRAVLLRGEVPRGEAPRILGMPERTARTVTSKLVALGLLTSDTPKGALKIGFPISAVEYYFPKLYPAGLDEDFKN
jgi:Fic family protein